MKDDSSKTKSSSADKFKSEIKKYPIALKSPSAHLCLWLVAAIGLALDLFTKKWALAELGSPDYYGIREIVLIPKYVCLTTVYNPGAVAGFLSGKTALLIIISIVALFFLFCLFAVSRADQRLWHFSLGLLFAGALGNLHDRWFNTGKVIDFIEIDLHFWPADPWPTFNIADVLLCVGVGLLLLDMIIIRSQDKDIKSTQT